MYVFVTMCVNESMACVLSIHTVCICEVSIYVCVSMSVIVSIWCLVWEYYCLSLSIQNVCICGYRHRLVYMYVSISVIKDMECLSLSIRTVCICVIKSVVSESLQTVRKWRYIWLSAASHLQTVYVYNSRHAVPPPPPLPQWYLHTEYFCVCGFYISSRKSSNIWLTKSDIK